MRLKQWNETEKERMEGKNDMDVGIREAEIREIKHKREKRKNRHILT